MPERKSFLITLVVVLTALMVSPSLTGGAEGRRAGQNATDLDPDFRPHLGTSHYLFELNGINVGTGWITLERDGDRYRMSYEARTNSRIDRLYRARYRGEGVMETDPLKPLKARLHQHVRSKTKDIAISFDGKKGRIITTETQIEEGEEPEREVRETRAGGTVLDPFSTVLLLQGVDWELGKEKVFEVYTGSNHYEARFTCVDKTDLGDGDDPMPAWVITGQSRKLDEDPDEDRGKESPSVRIYVAAEGYPDVLRVETTRRIGRITLTLVEFEPAREG
ncbi:MAG TPA: DUF3108 domain-containing protein [Deltaproteobacteria bacterium]|jgi:hypothetical protein|nr:DUF3108 domain-containing protein [Deltaproteobacteria bacterium]HOI07558.1 DUF3108 domain-containing protein [Deltaproteobacteria bacterium]